MAVNVILYDAKRRKIARPVTTREEYLALRDSQQNRKADKKHMVQMNYCLVSPSDNGNADGCFALRGASTLGNSVGMDIDLDAEANAKEQSSQEICQRIMSKREELGLLMLERSASKGYHIVFRRNAGMSNEENLRWASDLLAVEFDKGAKDVTRVFFTPASEKLLFLDDEIFDRSVYSAVVKDKDTVEVRKEAEAVGTGGKHNYLGIPYDAIIEKYWEMFYEGKHPVTSNRDTLTYELANVLKHICGYDRQLLAEVIPCYDGFPETEKMKCIDSALSGKRTQMPRRLRDVLSMLRQQAISEGGSSDKASLDIVEALDEAMGQDELFHYNRLPQEVMVQGLKDTVDAAGHTLVMPAITAICPAIGARASGVQLDVHGKPNSLNLIAYISGDFASGKGQIDDIVKAWMSEDIAMAEMYNQQWAEYAEQKKQCKNKKEQPVEPKFPKVWLTLNNTTANLAEELANMNGKHAFSFTPEADVVSLKWKTSVSDFSTMIRQSYDGSSYDREARSVEAVNVHIPRLLWNVVMCGTPDALYRVVNNYTDGFQSRIAVARTPDNTFARLDDKPAHLSDLQRERIEQVSHLLPLLNGTIVLPELEAQGRAWLEEVRLETMKDDDRVMARQRFRICVTAQRMTCCLMLSAVCADLIGKYGVKGAETRLKADPKLWQRMTQEKQTRAYMEVFDLIAESLLENAMYFFRERIEKAFGSSSYAGGVSTVGRTRRSKNDSIYERLPQTFSFAEAMAQSVKVKNAGATVNSVQQMLKNWRNQGLISKDGSGNFSKIVQL